MQITIMIHYYKADRVNLTVWGEKIALKTFAYFY